LAQVAAGDDSPIANSATAAPGDTIAAPSTANESRQNPFDRSLDRNQGVHPASTISGNAGGQFGIELGVVSVRPDGSGQLQQLVEGIRVVSIVGQSVIVVPNDVAIAAGTATAAGGSKPVQANRQPVANKAAGSFGVVATGIIQLVSGGAPAGQGRTGSTNAPPPGAIPGSNVASPAATGASASQSEPSTSATGIDRRRP
jgi:hypothetical protein